MLRQIEKGLQNGLSQRMEFSQQLSTFLFQKFCFSLETSCIELIWCTDHANVHIHTFLKHWSFTLGWFFFYEYSILKKDLNAAEIRTVKIMYAPPPRWNPRWRIEGAYLTKRFSPCASTSRACQSDAAMFDKDKQICFMLIPRTWFKVEEFRLE